jgi:AraC-like DNA-binding protein
MNIVVFAATAALERLRSALAPSYSLCPLTSLERMSYELDVGFAAVAIVDLDVCSEADLRSLTAIVSRHAPVVVAYGVVAPEFCRRVADLARHGLYHIVCRGVDDQPGNLRRVVRDAAAARLSVEVLNGLSPMLARASLRLREAVVELFHEPLRFRSAADVAEAAAVSRRSLDRSLHTLDLEPARTLVIAARVTWAYSCLRNGRVRVSEVSGQLGLSKPERFARHTRLLFGVPPAALRVQLSPDQFVERIVVRLRRQPSPSARGLADTQVETVSATQAWSAPRAFEGRPDEVKATA